MNPRNKLPNGKKIGIKTWNKLKELLPRPKQRRQLVPVYARTGKSARIQADQLAYTRALLRSITFVAAITMYISENSTFVLQEERSGDDESSSEEEDDHDSKTLLGM